MNVVHAFPLALAAALFAGGSAATPADLERMAWLAGCWESAGAEAGSGEQWTPIAGGTMLGMSRTVRQGRTATFEFMQLRDQPDGTLAFIAQPSGRAATAFPLLRMGEGEAVFESAQHDFPQRVIYARDGATRLRARIEGQRNGVARAIDFPMTRVSCDAQLGGLPK